MFSTKIILASQAHSINQYQNLRSKTLKCCANIYFNHQCLKKNPTPNYAKINMPYSSPCHRRQTTKNTKLRSERRN